MDPFSISVGALQIAGACGQATMTIIKWVVDVRTAGERIQGFYEEIVSLKATYDGLKDCLSSPVMVEAARTSNQTNDGRHLWAQVKTALDDSLHTINSINYHLDRINKTTGLMRRVRTQLDESLCKGELGRLRERVKWFNANISLPIQLVCVMLQLEQRDLNAEAQRKLDRRFYQIEQTMRELIVSLNYQSDTSLRGETLIVGSTDSSIDPKGKENYLTFARRILISASTAASTRSSLSTVSPQIDPPPRLELKGSMPNTDTSDIQQRRRTIPDWISSSNPEQFADQVVNAFGNSTSSLSTTKTRSDGVPFRLAQQYLKNGQEKAEEHSHESAEKNFKKALDLLAKHDFSGRIAFQPAEVVLMLSQSCLKQQKYDEAIALLIPVAEAEANIFPASCKMVEEAIPPGYQPDRLQSLAASQLLGEVFRDKGDHEQAKDHALKAFMDRIDELGEQDEKTLESVRLLIAIYHDMGDEEEAMAYEVFLTPGPPKKPTESIHTEVTSEENTAAASMSSLPLEIKASVPERPAPAKKTTSKWRNMLSGRNNSIDVQDRPKTDDRKTSFSRTTTVSSAVPETPPMFATLEPTTSPRAIPISHLTSPSDEAASRRLSSRADSWDSSSRPSIPSNGNPATNDRATASTAYLEPQFATVASLCAEGKLDRAAKVGLTFLESYPSPSFITRRDELKRNIRDGTSAAKGLAATGRGYAPIHYFCELRQECLDEVRMLVKCGVDVNTGCYRAGFTSGEVLTPLGLAIARGHERVAMLLVGAKGLKLDARDGDGMVPLLAAGRKGLYEVVRALIRTHGEKCVPAGDYAWPSIWYGNSVLHDAARHCDRELVGILLGAGIGGDINGQDRFGKTPLMYAVIKTDAVGKDRGRMCKQRLEVVRMLMEAGADVNRIDMKGLTASAYADTEGDESLKAAVGEARFELPVNGM